MLGQRDAAILGRQTGRKLFSIMRSKMLPRPMALALLFVGVTTIPVLFGTPLPIGPPIIWRSCLAVSRT